MKLKTSFFARPTAIGTILLSVFWLIACAGENMKLQEVPIPPGAVKAEISGAEKERFNNALTAALTAIKERFAFGENEIYKLPAETKWQDIAAFYDANLEKKGFARKSAAPLQSIDSQILFWERGNFIGKDNFAAALLEIKGETNQKYLVICTAKK